MSELDLEGLEAAAKAATAGDLDSAEIVRVGEILCPLCGDGTIEHKAFTNIDGQAIGVEVFGVGEKMADYERFARSWNPATALSVLSRLREAEAEVERLNEREKHFARALGVADGGQYRNDWDAPIRSMVSRATAAEARNKALTEALERFNIKGDQIISGDAGHLVVRLPLDVINFAVATLATHKVAATSDEGGGA